MEKATEVVYEYYKGAFALKRRKGGFEAGLIGGSSRLQVLLCVFRLRQGA